LKLVDGNACGRRVGPLVGAGRAYDPRSWPGIAWWHRPDSANVVLSGGKIITQADGSGQGRAGSVALASAPTWVADGGLNGRPSARYAGGQFLATPAFSLSTHTVFMVGAFSGAAGMLWEHSVNANFNDGHWLYASSGSTMMVQRGGTYSDKNRALNWANDGVVRAIRLEFDGTHAGNKLFANGAELALTNGTNVGNPGTGATSAQVLYIGSRAGTTAFVTGDIFDFFGFSPKLTAAQAQEVERLYIAPYFGLAVA
jgi:hypothetical protein